MEGKVLQEGAVACYNGQHPSRLGLSYLSNHQSRLQIDLRCTWSTSLT